MYVSVYLHDRHLWQSWFGQMFYGATQVHIWIPLDHHRRRAFLGFHDTNILERSFKNIICRTCILLFCLIISRHIMQLWRIASNPYHNMHPVSSYQVMSKVDLLSVNPLAVPKTSPSTLPYTLPPQSRDHTEARGPWRAFWNQPPLSLDSNHICICSHDISWGDKTNFTWSLYAQTQGDVGGSVEWRVPERVVVFLLNAFTMIPKLSVLEMVLPASDPVSLVKLFWNSLGCQGTFRPEVMCSYWRVLLCGCRYNCM